MVAVFCLVMSVSRCSACSAELLPEANFCRQCGVTVTSSSAVNSSEQPTLTLDERVANVTTQRLDPRPTSPDRGSLSNPARNSIAAADLGADTLPSRRRLPTASIVGGIAVVVVIVIVTSVAVVRMGSHSTTTDNAALIYPGSQTVVDMTSDEGRAIRLQTVDSLDRVLAWYEGSLKPTKTMRLTSTSFVLRNQNVTATIASENNKTNILIKQSPPR
ncbi:hypothetical protein BH18ACI4_BH18ACI4_24590 [soil metagenome]